MNVASKDLCKELEQLSDWDDTYWMYGARGLKPRTVLFGSKPTPAYDLGYLLRKLQDNDLTIIMRWNRDMHGTASMKKWDGKWCIGTFDMPQGDYPVTDTPEDAAAKLCIKLFKQGVLTKEGK